ncbi:N-hydroxyarylamine O-acetyltransferase [Erwinia sp. OLTSP20]|uniref:arylamine N-acetyltransferase n=1 Tax=unclassified Erwinia TaxID=2622719 RepID=UPI000C196504|nr:MULTISPECIES: arylamine N-acetyltransferase [unclassified Erwinia]PIJ49001.1 N-hydroxyarylamine O-acetyltransferase [Erwinia sp. OAMSP11]PIJ74995.1 N-hydroxyarylamine O-acetyltransferase [Erwinia sp. OLSSP12]PIJ79686.1 N-hydroxyarylamine O-acetyltransferase [Erwinia sp. OLCASP19]PIJ80471.1 N-hydroxyarylamine O-acetyltransferase [Erwinia sp. OLMTSP26]PIJ82586.1 N-hydroxyarylamine O-acetyltransferase [Erwinia sp. OLMDSP33]
MNDFLSRYFSRIGWTATPEVSVNTLRELVIHHCDAIPFENLDVLLGREIQLDCRSIEAKLIAAGRGGYCYEHSGLLQRVLHEIGFPVRSLMARVLISDPVAPPARTHRLLLTELGNHPWIVDAGFGGNTLTAPIPLQAGTVQQTRHNTYRLVNNNNQWTLQIEIDGRWQTMYAFDLSQQYDADYVMANFYVAHWPDSRFRHNLIMCRHLPDGSRLTLNNFLLSHKSQHRATEKYVIPDAATLYDVIQRRFALSVSDKNYGFSAPQLYAVMEKITAEKSARPSAESS